MVQNPGLRKELIFNIRSLADPIYQKRVWVDLELPVMPYEDNFDQAIHFLFDDMCLDTHIDQSMGVMLENAAEADAVQAVIEVLEIALENLPQNATDEHYINSIYWTDVISASRYAYRVLTGGQNPDGLFTDIQKGWPCEPKK